MSSKVAHLDYETRQISLRAKKKIPAVATPGISVSSVEEGQELSTWFWLARELVSLGLAEYSSEPLSQTEWTQVHFKERLNPASPPGPLPDEFYARAYQSFALTAREPEKASGLSRMRAWYREILESRIGRVARMASAEADSPTTPLQRPEHELYKMVRQAVLSWREQMRTIGDQQHGQA